MSLRRIRRAAGTGAAGHACWFARWAQGLLQELLNLRVGEVVEDEEAVPPIGDDAGLAEDPQLLRDVSLGAAQDGLEVTDAGLAPTELVEDLEARLMGQEGK